MNIKISVIALLLTFTVNAQDQKLPKYFLGENSVVIQGYDLVSYHTENSAVKGSNEYAMDYDGATFYFSSKKNKKTFKKNPEKYLPAYNGYCAFGLGKAQKRFPVDPKNFKIIDGKLYLFFHGPIRGKVTNALDLWNMEESKLKEVADSTWKLIEQN